VAESVSLESVLEFMEESDGILDIPESREILIDEGL